MNTKITYNRLIQLAATLGLNQWHIFRSKSILKLKLIIILEVICVILYTVGFEIKLRILTSNLFM